MGDPSDASAQRRSQRIRELNDAFRTSFVGGRVLITQGVNSLHETDREAVLALVRSFTQFDADCDPHGEHDFVSVVHDGTAYFAKIDYYDSSMEHASEDPSDPRQTVRVMTIMRADEY
jgi:hypothetical protein